MTYIWSGSLIMLPKTPGQTDPEHLEIPRGLLQTAHIHVDTGEW